MNPYTKTYCSQPFDIEIELSKDTQGYVIDDTTTGTKYFRYVEKKDSQTIPPPTPTLPTGWNYYADPAGAFISMDAKIGAYKIKIPAGTGYYAIIDDIGNMYIELPAGMLWA